MIRAIMSIAMYFIAGLMGVALVIVLIPWVIIDHLFGGKSWKE